MKKLLSVLLAAVLLFSLGLLPASATENIEDKDDSRIDIGEIFGYYQTVTFVEGETETSKDFERNTKITYPALTPARGSDYVWSLSESEYSPVPELMPEEDITVYAFNIPFVGFENYPSVPYINYSNVVGVSSDYAYSGTKSLKYFNQQYSSIVTEPTNWSEYYNNYYTYDSAAGVYTQNTFTEAPTFESGKYYESRKGEREHSVALGNASAGTAYKLSFKYYVPAALNADYYVVPYTGLDNIWGEGSETTGMRVDYTESTFTVSKDSETGVWLDGAMYFTADEKAINSYNYIYLWLKASGYNNNDTIYFDHITVDEMLTADFAISDSVVLSSTNGVLKDNVFTAYYPSDAEITAPEVTTLDGTPVRWKDADGNTVTEFVAGGVYSLKLDSKGDLNVDGAVSTIDLALIKLYLVEAVDDSELNVDNADINLNGKVDIVDMAYLKLYLAGAIKEL